MQITLLWRQIFEHFIHKYKILMNACANEYANVWFLRQTVDESYIFLYLIIQCDVISMLCFEWTILNVKEVVTMSSWMFFALQLENCELDFGVINTLIRSDGTAEITVAHKYKHTYT